MNKQLIEDLRIHSRQLVRELGLLQIGKLTSAYSAQHWHALIEIDKSPGITISELAHLLLITQSTMSRIIAVLVKDKLVSVKPGLDKRARALSITQKGLNETSKIDQYSIKKIKGAFHFLTEDECEKIVSGISLYADALEKSRRHVSEIKIFRLGNSRVIRKQIISMVTKIQKDEFKIPVTDEINRGILTAEGEYRYHNSLNFWYATDQGGRIIGSIGLKKINAKSAELKKMFVAKSYRNFGLAQKLLFTLLKAAQKHGFSTIYLGTVSALKGAHQFYVKCGFNKIQKQKMPKDFEFCKLDTMFFKGNVNELNEKISLLAE